jgi:hypothetical protein
MKKFFAQGVYNEKEGPKILNKFNKLPLFD